MKRGQGGFALLVVLWTMGFLALLGTQIVVAGRSATQLADNLKQEAVLKAAAEGAVAAVVFRMAAARDGSFLADGVTRELRIGQTPVRVSIENESDRVNLNTASASLLRALIMQLGAAPALADGLAAAILDWRTSGTSPRPGGAKAPEYRAAGRSYGPPGTPFQSVDEAAGVLGMTAELFGRLAPHLTVLTNDDPDLSTRDPVVARALADAAPDIGTDQREGDDQVWRISVTALGTGASRYAAVVVASSDFRSSAPHVNILLQDPGY